MKKHFFLLVFLPISLSLYSQRAEDYRNITEDGAWCWFSDPRALYYEGNSQQTFSGMVTSEGDVMAKSYNHRTQEIKEYVLYEKLQVDDHASPSFLILPDGKIMTFFSRHNGTLFYTTSEIPEDITTFKPVDSLDLGSMMCYTNPVLLKEENNRIYVFFRGGYDWKPSFITSDDMGKTWSDPQSFVSKEINNIYNRPYTKVISDGNSSIHFAFTDGHPREENQNSIYYLHYKKGKFHDITGNIVGDLLSLPLKQEDIPKVYDGVANNQRAWIWELALTEDQRPVMVYSVLPEETTHYYHYASWTGEEWRNTRICRAGAAFPRLNLPKHGRDPEPHYSGGITIDNSNPSVVYTSRPIEDRFEIEKWTTEDEGKTFSSTTITQHSLQDNVRPFVVRNAPLDVTPRLLWMYIDHYKHYTNFQTAIKSDLPGDSFSSEIASPAIKEAMTAVADWQIDRFDLVKHHWLDWTNGALYTGMMAWAKVSKDEKYMDWLTGIGRRYKWQPFLRMYHADDVVVSQMYLEMYKEKKDQKGSYRILGPTKARLEYVVNNPSQGTLLLNYKDPQTLERWSWCDALFMAPPVYAKLYNITGDQKYLDFMHREFKATYDFLYDPKEHLFYRDQNYFPDKKREINGEKVFWGRGNGWVMGGLVSILKDLPANHEYRPFYETLFKEMAEKVATRQGKEGFWHASMLDHDSYPNPETSSTAFFTYALTYGINAGLLDKSKYQPIVIMAWKAMIGAIYPDGKLGWVQPIGENPKNVTAEMTEVYGVGAFLLAGTEMLKLVDR